MIVTQIIFPMIKFTRLSVHGLVIVSPFHVELWDTFAKYQNKTTDWVICTMLYCQSAEDNDKNVPVWNRQAKDWAVKKEFTVV